MTLTIVEEISAIMTELSHLKEKSTADDSLIQLLKTQNEQQAQEITAIRHEYDTKLQKLKQERDVSLQRSTETEGIIRSIGSMALTGVRVMNAEPVNHPKLPSNELTLVDKPEIDNRNFDDGLRELVMRLPR